MVGVRSVAVARSGLRILARAVLRIGVPRRERRKDRRGPCRTPLHEVPAGGGRTNDLPRFLASSDMLACEQLTGMASPALLHVEQRHLQGEAKSPAQLKRLAETIAGTRGKSNRQELYVEVAVAVVAVVFLAALVKFAAMAPRIGLRTVSPQEPSEPAAVRSAATDDIGATERRLSFAAGFHAGPAYEAWQSARFEVDPRGLTPAGIPSQFLSDIMTGAIDSLGEEMFDLDLPLTIEPDVEATAVAAPPPAKLRKKSFSKNRRAMKRRRVQQAEKATQQQKPMPIAGSKSLLFGEMFTPAEGPPPTPDAAASATPESSQSLGLFPVSPYEAEANRW